MKKLITTVLLFLLSILSLFSQEDYIKNKWKIKAAKSSHYISSSKNANNYQLELSYGIINYLEVGLYGGYTLRDYHSNDRKNITYGVNLNFHILPFITEGKVLKFIDTYVTANLGVNCFIWEPYNVLGGGKEDGGSEYFADQGVGGGLALYPLDKVGIFTEYTFGHYFLRGNHRFRFGVVVRF